MMNTRSITEEMNSTVAFIYLFDIKCREKTWKNTFIVGLTLKSFFHLMDLLSFCLFFIYTINQIIQFIIYKKIITILKIGK